MTTDALADALAREEHQQGMPVGVQVGHCETCDERIWNEALAMAMDNCAHDDVVDITPLGEPPGSRQICAFCGATP